jgi:hypothetical protein
MHELVEQYRAAIERHCAAMSDGDAEKANLAVDDAENTLKKLVVAGEDQQLLDLFNDINPTVQLWAAVHTLEIAKQRALGKLHQIKSANIPMISLEAEISINEWRLGRLRVRKRLGLIG